MQNWRTSLSGILMGLVMLGGIWAPKELQPKIDQTEKALIVMGLIVAADAARKIE